jgi:two-component system, response regulator YesN
MIQGVYRMLKMLIIEDERWEREGLLDFLDWNRLGIEIAGLACDGVEGMELAYKTRPDIIITDIKMPGIDGITMSKKIKEFLPKVKIIILTGYDDFKYAKEAINFSANGYVLKPVEEQEMLDIVLKVTEECESENKRIEEEENMKVRLKETYHAAKSRFLAGLLEGRLETQKIEEQMAAFQMHIHHSENLTVAALKPLHLQEVQSENMASAISLAGNEEDILNALEDIFTEQVVFVFYDEVRKEFFICLRIADDMVDLMNEAVETSVRAAAEKYGLKFVVGIGDLVVNLMDLKESCQQAIQALEFEVFWNESGISCYSRISSIRKDFHDIVGEFLMRGSYFSKQLLYSVRASDEERVMDLLKEMFEFIQQNKGAGREMIFNYLYGIMNEVSLLAYNLNRNVQELEENNNEYGRELAEISSFDSFQEHMYEFFERILSFIGGKKGNKDEAVVKKVMQLVEERYMTDLSLKLAAGEVFLSPNYLGSIFRKCTGKSFNDYVCGYRMEKARELLHSPKNKVNWVASEVGIPNTSYFCTIFKNTYGIAPGEYQETILRGI